MSKSNIKIVERDKTDTLTHKYVTNNTHICDHTLSWLGAGTSTKIEGLN